MQIIIIGCGKVGAKLASVLSKEGHDIVIVDNDRNAFKLLEPDFNGVTITGVPIDQDILKQAGIEMADALAAVTPDDNINITTCQIAREIFKVPRVIARIYNPSREQVFHQFGLETICPTNITVDEMRSMLFGSTHLCSHLIGRQEIGFTQEKVSKRFEGQELGTLETSGDVMIFGVMRKGNMLLAKPDIKLEKDDVLVIARIDKEK